MHAPVSISNDTAERFIEETGGLTNVSWLTSWDYPPASWDEEDSSLWFSVPLEYGKYLCKERSNSFVLALLWYAMVTGSDIEFDAPLSKRLHDGLTKRLMPALEEDGYGAIRLLGPVSDEPVWNEGGVVTGLTCGADSTYALHVYGGDDAPEGLKLTHAVYAHADYLFPYLEPPYDVDELIAEHERRYNAHALEGAKYIASQHGLPLIEIKTNYDRDYYRGGLIYTGPYRFLSCTMALEHLFAAYLITSSGSGSDSEKASLLVPHYSNLIVECCSTESLRLVSSDNEERYTKLEAIADDTAFQKSVSVCSNDTEDGKNCGECFGCWKTMVPLDVMGKLDKYGERFDLDKYYSNRRGVFEDMIRFSQRPESRTPRKIVAQILRHADESGKAGALFKEIYEECSMDRK